MIKYEEIEAVNPVLSVNNPIHDAPSIEQSMGITPVRAKELATQLDVLKNSVIAKGGDVSYGTTIGLMSKIAATPEELVWLTYKLGTFAEKLANPLSALFR